jgi:hypothetical protein
MTSSYSGLIERGRALIEARVEYDTNGGCWLWSGSHGQHGRVSFDGAMIGTHRLSYEAFKGPIPDGLWVLHKCDVPACCNPDHLFVGTHQENVQDAVSKGRMWAQKPENRTLARERMANAAAQRDWKGEKVPTAKLTPEKVREIRACTDSLRAIGRRYGIHEKSVRQIKNRRNWAHVE